MPRSAARHDPRRAAVPLAGACLLAALAAVAPRAHAAPALPTLSDDTLLRAPWSVREPADAAVETTDRLIVRYHAGSSGARLARIATVSRTAAALAEAGVPGGTLRRNAFGAHLLKLERPLTLAAAAALARRLEAADWSVASVEVDRRLHAFATPSDPSYPAQWDYFEAAGGLNLPAAWDLATGAGVVVAVIDTGVRPHADLAANLLAGYDFIANSGNGGDGDARDADASDPGDGHAAGACGAGSPASHSTWHGTHVAGTVAAVADNGQGIAGVAHGARVLPVRVLGRCGGYTSDIADAIVWASGGSVPGVPDAATPARVLNLSLGGAGACGATLQAAVAGARARGALVVVAAGNSNQDSRNFNPANCAGVLSVAASTRRGGKAGYSNFGPAVTLAAPGGAMASPTDANGILSTLNDGLGAPGNDVWRPLQGTSMAAPHVAGVAALMMARDAALTGDEAMALLRASAHPLALGCGGCGAGLVDAGKAVASVVPAASVSSRVGEVEPNEDRAGAQAIASLPAKVAGVLSSATDVDTFQVSVPAHAAFRARLLPNPLSTYSLTLMGAAGKVLATRSNPAGWPEAVTFTNPNAFAATYFVQVRRVSGVGGANGRYTLEMFTP